MISLILSYLKSPISLKRYQVTALIFGCIGLFVVLFLYDRQSKKTDQYGELNVFLENRLKALQGERTVLERSLQEAIEKGLNTQNNIEKQHEDDTKNAMLWRDTVTTKQHLEFFKKRVGSIRQHKKR